MAFGRSNFLLWARESLFFFPLVAVQGILLGHELACNAELVELGRGPVCIHGLS